MLDGDTDRDSSAPSASFRIEECLARFRENREAAIDELTGLIYDRFRALTGRILSRQFPVLHGQTDDACHDALLRLHTALRNENVAPHNQRELCGLAARHIRFALHDLVSRHRRAAQQFPEPPDQSAQSLGQFAVELTTFDPERLAAWTEFQEGVQRLDAELREVIDLVLYGGLTHQEAADALGVPLTTVQWRWRAVKVRLALAGAECLPV